MARSECRMIIDISGKEYSQDKVKALFQSIEPSDYYEYEFIKDEIGEERTRICLEDRPGGIYDVKDFYDELVNLIQSTFKDITVSIFCSFADLRSDGRYNYQFERNNKKDSYVEANIPKDYAFYDIYCPKCGELVDLDYDPSDAIDICTVRENQIVATCSKCSNEIRALDLFEYLEKYEEDDFDSNSIYYSIDEDIE